MTGKHRRQDSANPSEDGAKEPARSQSIPGPTYDNPNDGAQDPAADDDEADADEEHRR